MNVYFPVLNDITSLLNHFGALSAQLELNL